MANTAVRCDLYPPRFAKKFGANATAILHSTDAPSNCQVLPCGFLADTSAALTFKDSGGTSVTMTPAAGVFVPISMLELTGAGPALTVFWNPEP